jgi:hypothetical protein
MRASPRSFLKIASNLSLRDSSIAGRALNSTNSRN